MPSTWWRLIVRRSLTRSDARAAADLWLCARKAAIGAIPQPVHDDDDVRAWFASHVVCQTELWIAEDRAGTLVGILVLEERWPDQLYVEPTITGRGIGAGLVQVAPPSDGRLALFAQRRSEADALTGSRLSSKAGVVLGRPVWVLR